MALGDARDGKWRGNWRMEWVASTLHTTSERGVSGITTADAHTSAASSQLNWLPLRWFKWTRPFRRKTKSDFSACAITFQTQSTGVLSRGGGGTPKLYHLPPSSADIKNQWNCTSVRPYALMPWTGTPLRLLYSFESDCHNHKNGKFYSVFLPRGYFL